MAQFVKKPANSKIIWKNGYHFLSLYYKVPNNSRGGNNSTGGTNASILIIVGSGIIVGVGNLNFHNNLVRKVGGGKKANIRNILLVIKSIKIKS